MCSIPKPCATPPCPSAEARTPTTERTETKSSARIKQPHLDLPAWCIRS
ncbi:hypothetical protein NPIL_70851, partial [Nephila pilipes]